MRHGSIVPTHALYARIPALALAALWVVLAPAFAESPDPAGQDKEEPAAVSETRGEEPEPQDGEEEWPLVDEVTGQSYRIEKLPRVEGAYYWLEEGKRVQMPLGVDFEVVKHDDEWFWVKYYKPVYALPTLKRKKQGPTDEELESAAASYRFETATSDRLRFEEFDRGLPRQGQWRHGFDVADMNGDGHLDIVFGPARKGIREPNIFLGDGTGNWRRWNEASFPPLPYDYGDAEAADFNGDGHQDLALGIHLSGMTVMVSDGGSGFQPWSEGIPLGQPGGAGDPGAFSSRAIAATDWNGDGKLDLIGLGEGPKGTGQRRPGGPRPIVDTSRDYLVYLNRGDGTWQRWRPLQSEVPTRPDFGDEFVIADLNGDELPDLVGESRQMSSKRILRLGAGSGTVTIAAVPQMRPSGLVTAVAVADLNGDPHPDLILGYTNRELRVHRSGIDLFYGAPDPDTSELGWERRPLVNEESRRGITSLATGELDGDGHTDLAALTGDGEILFFLGDGDGFFLREMEALTPREQGCEGFGLRLVDLDGDGRDEVIASFAGEQTGYPGIPGLSHPGCERQGSLRAWKAVPAPQSP